MALFGRKQPGVDTVPQEVREYYQSERRERAGVAWLLALGTLVVTLLLASGIFFGGRWVYRTVTHKNSGGTQTAQSGNKDNNKTGTSSTHTTTPSTNSGNTGSSSGTSSPSASQGGQQSTGGVGSSSSSGQNTAPAGGSSSSAPAPAGSGQSGASSSQLANTGPGDTVAVFVVATIMGAVVHYVVTTRRTEMR